MKIAGVHDRIFHLGGAESVFFDLFHNENTNNNDIEATIFTLFSDKTSVVVQGTTVPVITALPRWLNNIFVRGSRKGYTLLDYRNLFVVYPILCFLLRKKIEVFTPDKVVLSSFAAAKNIIPPEGSSSRLPDDIVLYLHSPNQYIRENNKEYKEKISGRKGKIFTLLTPYLRRRDSKPRTYKKILCNSEYTKTTAKKIYGVTFEKAEVQYPAIDPAFATTVAPSVKKDYFVYVGRLTMFVREVDKIISLFNETGEHLIIIGSGPDELVLRQMAKDNIIFLGQIQDVKERIKIMKYARGCINLAKESCGMVNLEAKALGLTIFGYNQGGTAEIAGIHGVLIEKKDTKSIRKGFEKFLTIA